MRIAIVGSGISGLAAGWLLDRKHDVHLFEKRPRLGGHTHTVVHDIAGRRLPLDTGFIVYNELTYPNLTRVFEELEVETRSSEMSFSVSCRNPDVEYASHSLRGLFAQHSLLFSATHLRMLADVVRFGRRGRRLLAGSGDPSATIADFLDEGRFSEAFARYFLMPMTAAIWSSGTEVVSSFPRDSLLRFLHNHGLLQVTGQPDWRTVVGGSWNYIAPMVRSFEDRVHLGRGVKSIRRNQGDVELQSRGWITPHFRSRGHCVARRPGAGHARRSNRAGKRTARPVDVLSQRHLVAHGHVFDASAPGGVGLMELPDVERRPPAGTSVGHLSPQPPARVGRGPGLPCHAQSRSASRTPTR